VGVRIEWASLLAGVLLLALPAAGQVEVGKNLSMDLNGTLGTGYSGDYGNDFGSSHSISGSGTGTLSGSYYNPNFLSFAVSPYYGQSRANSNYQSVFDSSGVTASTSIFSGSHFPGSINFAKAYNSEGTSGIPGVSDYTTRGNSDTFGISWSENLPDEPSLSASFQRGGDSYSVFGTDQNGNSTFNSLTLHSGYLIHQFGLGAFYQRGGSTSLIPELLEGGETPEKVNSSNSGYGFNVTHPLPVRGGFSASFTHSDFDTNVEGSNINGSVDLITTNAGIQPTDKLHLAIGANYSDSLSGQIEEQIIQAGGITPQANLNEGSHSLDVIASAGYALAKGLQTEVDAERREQRYLGETFTSNAYGGSLFYTRGLLGGNLNASASVRDTSLANSGQNSVGFSGNVNFTRRIDDWVMTGAFGYSQDVETLLINYTSSFYNYSGNIRRRWGQFTWSAGAGGGRTGLTVVGGTQNTNSSYTTSIGYSRFITLSGNYAKSSGNGIESPNGIIQNPVLVPVLTPGSAILFSGDTYSVGFGSNPAKKLTIGASYARANNNNLFNSVRSTSSTMEYTTLLQYQVRKLYLTGGYTRLQQGFSLSNTGPAVISSFYVGLSRWFNFF